MEESAHVPYVADVVFWRSPEYHDVVQIYKCELSIYSKKYYIH